MEQLIEFAGDNLLWVTLWLALLLLLVWNMFGPALMGVSQIEPMEMTRLINHERALVLDVRRAEDYDRGHVINAINIPEQELAARKQELKKSRDKPVIVYDQNGTSTTRALKLLKEDGFSQTYSLKGGITAWQRASLPLTQAPANAGGRHG